jgi:hypothetical protein
MSRGGGDSLEENWCDVTLARLQGLETHNSLSRACMRLDLSAISSLVSPRSSTTSIHGLHQHIIHCADTSCDLICDCAHYNGICSALKFSK